MHVLPPAANVLLSGKNIHHKIAQMFYLDQGSAAGIPRNFLQGRVVNSCH